MIRRVSTLLLALALSLLPRPSLGSFHLMKIVEIFPGTTEQPNAQYVMLQMYSSGQQFVGGHDVKVFDAIGNPVADVVFASNVSNGANQATILIATQEAEALFGVTRDFAISAVLTLDGGKACYEDLDCVSWGTSTSSNTMPSPSGPPFNPSGGLVRGMAMRRNLGLDGNPATLSGADDTNDSQHDFGFAAPKPKNNAGMTGTLPAAATPTATPNVGQPTATATATPIEGQPSATVTSTVLVATPTPTATGGPCLERPCSGCDCDGSGDVTVDELITLVNIALGSAQLSNCGGADADCDGEIAVNEIISCVNRALNGCTGSGS